MLRLECLTLHRNGMHPTGISVDAMRKIECPHSYLRAGEILCSVSSILCLLCPLRVERPARLEHAVSQVDEFAHRRPDDRQLALASSS